MTVKCLSGIVWFLFKVDARKNKETKMLTLFTTSSWNNMQAKVAFIVSSHVHLLKQHNLKKARKYMNDHENIYLINTLDVCKILVAS